jgi:hypothetical protein
LVEPIFIVFAAFTDRCNVSYFFEMHPFVFVYAVDPEDFRLTEVLIYYYAVT